MPIDQRKTIRGALAGALAAGAWAAQMPLDKRLFASEFDDVELLGKTLTRSRGWPLAGWIWHVQNGALFGAVYANLAPRIPLPSWARGPALAMAENFLTWPLVALSDRLHPAREQLPKSFASPRALAQSTWRHALFGILLGELERAFNRQDTVEMPAYEHVISSNGHGKLEHATSAN
ncbi:MAG: hypothetical protein ACRDK2_00090 [Solirubrobacteraceae bacterium]